jgi:hypothetical protein
VARKGPLNKLVDAAFGVVKDPVGATGKTLGVAKEAVAIGRMLAGQVTRLAVDKVAETAGGSSDDSAPTQQPDEAAPPLRSVPPVKRPAEPTPVKRPGPPVPAQSSDPATTGAPAKKATGAPARKAAAPKAPAGKAPAKKAPAGTAPAKKTPAKKIPAKKAPAKAEGDPTMVTPADIAENVAKQPAEKAARTTAKKAPAAKKAAKAPAAQAPAKKSAANKATPATVAKKASAKKAAKKTVKTVKQVADVDGPSVTTPAGTTAAAEATNPDTTEHDLQQPGTEPIVDPGTAKAIRSEAQTLQRAADTDKS